MVGGGSLDLSLLSNFKAYYTIFEVPSKRSGNPVWGVHSIAKNTRNNIEKIEKYKETSKDVLITYHEPVFKSILWNHNL